MKTFVEPSGFFSIEIPNDWQYKNRMVGIDAKSPFSFEIYKNEIGCFQISFYKTEKLFPDKEISSQKFDTANLNFFTNRLDDKEFNIHLWYTLVEEFTFMAKYIYDSKNENLNAIQTELKKVENSLSTLKVISLENRKHLLDYDKYEKFIASFGASWDLRFEALKNNSLIELIIIIANQIDAFLRISIVLQKQINENTNDIDSEYLFQDENDTPIFERKIYKFSKEFGIISQKDFDILETLYAQRNKVVHRYIISEFNTKDLYQIVINYIKICDYIGQNLEKIENEQYSLRIGIYGQSDPKIKPTKNDLKELFSKINDKHLVEKFIRDI